MTRSIAEAGASLSSTQIPETLQGSLLARLDRLGVDAKEIAQIAATIGREFDRSLLCMIADKPEKGVDEALDRLTASQIDSARREFAHSFGSCSFEEPIDGLRELGLLL